MEMRFKIFRFDPELDREPRYQDYVVSARPEERILDCLNRIRWEQDGTLAYRMSCAHGVCGSDGMKINGRCALACQKLVKDYLDGEVVLEPLPFFPVVKDLIVDRGAFDRIIAAGGYISANTGAAGDGNAMLIGKEVADKAFDAAACLGCGACVAACKNAAAMLFVGAKVAHLGYLPQGQPERSRRALRMVEQMEREGFGACSNEGECEAVCPKGISTSHIQILQKDYIKAVLKG